MSVAYGYARATGKSEDEAVKAAEMFRAFGGGKAPDGLCGALYAAKMMQPDHGEAIEEDPDGYRESCVLQRVKSYPTKVGSEGAGVAPVMLKLTHGTGDDNVHFQNTLQLIDVLHRMGAGFEFMIYPDGMHGYHGYQGAHFQKANREFWKKYLLSE